MTIWVKVGMGSISKATICAYHGRTQDTNLEVLCSAVADFLSTV